MYGTFFNPLGLHRSIASMVACRNSPEFFFFCPIATNKVSLGRVWKYLNADRLFVKIGAKMTSWRAFEVGRRIAAGRRGGQSKIFGAAGCIAIATPHAPVLR